MHTYIHVVYKNERSASINVSKLFFALSVNILMVFVRALSICTMFALILIDKMLEKWPVADCYTYLRRTIVLFKCLTEYVYVF